MKPATGIKNENLLKVAQLLNGFLADEFVLSLKTKNAHWNVEGRDFHAMHIFFEEQYHRLDEVIDDVAERIRILGHYAPATLKSYLELTHLTEQTRENNDSTGLIKDLLGDHESIITRIREVGNYMANDLQDAGTSDFITSLMETHEKMAWMLRAHLK